ncbi:MAG: FAD-dependent oxidoreductase, partial [Planctomycetota bacterium]
MSIRLVIVGGVAGGASAAARARRLNEDADITIVERSEAPSFANCGLPYYVGGVIKSRARLLVTREETLRLRYRLDVRTRSEALAIDRSKKIVRVRDLASDRTYDLPYDKLILSPGATPLVPPIPGADLPGVFTLRDLHDADTLRSAASRANSAMVIGGGFIGLEMAENLVHQGVATTIVELASQILPPWDSEMAAPIADHLKESGVTLHLSDAAERIAEHEGRLQIHLRSGAHASADLVVMSVGVRPENQLAVDAGLDVAERGGIVVNRHMQTSDADVYAVGDAVQVEHFVDQSPAQIPLGGPANRQGRIAADHMFGRDSAYRGTQGTAVVGVFGMTAAMTGLSEKALKAADVLYEKAYVHPSHHAGYFPGAEAMSVKMLFQRDGGNILGAQIIGGSGVDKRIDVLAMAIQARLTVYDLEESELAYAPQYGSAKDPVNMV